ncbi:acyltransferase [Kiritimatiellaeota bacterium B1221]|nr:acyltransferase [Kiritimatiellaeota bacterium B1221]
MMLSTGCSWLSLTWQGCRPGRGVRSTGRCLFKARRAHSIRIGNAVYFASSQRSNRIGLASPVVLETLGEGEIEIGEGCGLSACVLSSRESICLGAFVKVGANVKILDHDFHSLDWQARRTDADSGVIQSKAIVIEDDVFIGVNSLILKGVHIGRRSIIAAGSVVTRDVPEGEIWGGNPAKKLRDTV